MVLARCRVSGELVAAGAHQAEYQVWMCEAELADTFPGQAFRLLRKLFPTSTLKLSYLPAETPLGWLAAPAEGRMAVVKTARRPLLTLGGDDDSLRKSGNKSRLRQLRKHGAVEFRA